MELGAICDGQGQERNHRVREMHSKILTTRAGKARLNDGNEAITAMLNTYRAYSFAPVVLLEDWRVSPETMLRRYYSKCSPLITTSFYLTSGRVRLSIEKNCHLMKRFTNRLNSGLPHKIGSAAQLGHPRWIEKHDSTNVKHLDNVAGRAAVSISAFPSTF